MTINENSLVTDLYRVPPYGHLLAGHFVEGRGYAVKRRRGTTDWLLIYTVAGHGRFGYDGGEYVTESGDFVLIRPGTPHDYGVDPSRNAWELLWTHFNPRVHWTELLSWPELTSGTMLLTHLPDAVRQRAVTLLQDAHKYATGGYPRGELFALNALEELLLWCDTVNPLSNSPRLDPRVQNAVEYLCSHLAEKTDLATLARACYMSVSRLAHLFREQVGISPQQYLEQQRILRARQLLDSTSRPIQNVAADVGFDNPFYFSLRFKKHTGVSPTEYRTQRSR